MSGNPFEDAFTTGYFGEQHHSAEEQVHVRALPHGLHRFFWSNEAEYDKRKRARNSPYPLADAEKSGENADDAADADSPNRCVRYGVSPRTAAPSAASEYFSDYGQLIVDECHHLSARSFELVTQRSKARYVLGLSATVTRKDGHHPIIFMQCGPVRHRVDPKAQAARRSFEHIVRLHETSFILSPFIDDTKHSSMASIYAELARDEQRNTLIYEGVADALENGRSPLVLTEQREHIDTLQARFEQLTPNAIVLRGGMGIHERRRLEERMRASQDEKRILLATGRYLGEGFDDPRLDTLFLTVPISWKGTLAQYVGRLHREHDGKSEVVVHDYVDVAVPFLVRMANKRQAGYRTLGYVLR